MNRTRLIGLSLVAASAAALATLAPAGAATPVNGGITWRQRPVEDTSSFTEPSLAISKTGDIAVCAPGGTGGTQNWTSTDDGKTFFRSHTNGDGGGDCEIHFLPDGTLVNSDLAVSTSHISYTKDLGQTWTAGDDAGPEQDRQWFASYNSGEPTLYHVYHGIAEEAEYYVKSTDEGKTWSQVPTPINAATQANCTPGAVAKPGDTACLTDQSYNTFSGPMLVDQSTGELYVVYAISDAQNNATGNATFGNPRGIIVAHSTDGTNWTNRYAAIPGGATIGQDYVASGFPWGTIDAAGNVYIVYTSNVGGHYHTYYSYSTDHSETWSAPVKIDDNPDGEGETVFGTGMGGAPGMVDFAWIETDKAVNTDDDSAVWYINFAQVKNATSGSPTITDSRVSDHPSHLGNICLHGTLCAAPRNAGGGSRSLGDFFELAIGPDGLAQVAWTDDGREGEAKQVWWAKQTSGSSILGGGTVQPPATGGGSTGGTTGGSTGGSNGGSNSGGSGSLPTTGLPGAMPVTGAVLLGVAGVALAARRRRDA